MSSSNMLPSAVPIPTQAIPVYDRPIRSFTIHNGNTDPISTMYVGTMRTIPPVNVVGPHADTDADGNPIPGTAVFTDEYRYMPHIGDEICIFDALKAVMHILGIRVEKDENGKGRVSEATGPYALRGLSLLPRHAPASMWKEIAAAGEHRSYLFRVDQARKLINAWDERNAVRRRNGLAETSPDYACQAASSLVAEYNRSIGSIVSTPIPAPHQISAEDEELEILAIAESIAMELVKKVKLEKTEDEYELLKRLMNKPEVMQRARKDFRIRRRGHMAVSSEALKEAMINGQTVAEVEGTDGDEE